MCKIHGFRYGCGHTTYRILSSCRGTYASLASPQSPRCVPSASLVLRIESICNECRYSHFCHEWQGRIDEVKQRRDTANSILNESGSPNDLWGSDWHDSDDCDAEIGWQESTSEASIYHVDHSASIQSEAPITTALQQTVDLEVRHSLCDFTAVRCERDLLNAELERLQAEYNAEAWESWGSVSGGANEDAWSRTTSNTCRPRKISPREVGKSPLSSVTNIVDLMLEVNESQRRTEGEGEEVSDSDSSDPGDDGSTISVSSLPSLPSSNPGRAWDVLATPLRVEGYCAQSTGSLTADWIDGVNNIHLLDLIEDEDESHGLPNWGIA